ncbi:MAG: xanthine dehydrogenase small subunit [Proteobacteria bacterium]|nr:xanthine dehydrogenase small subunit [Pseudomonadota bacterium]
MRATIRFLLGAHARELPDVDPTRTVLQYLREDEALCGTKEGCAEGDCGACTVTLAERDGRGGIRYRAVNSCIMFMPALDGRQLLAVEHLADDCGGLHPVQQAMVDHHASQCGFCTPGFVMSLATLYMAGDNPGRDDTADALAGNLCRCTGYRPILDAARAALAQPARSGDEATISLRARLDALDTDSETLAVEGAGRRYVAPRSLAELTAILTREPSALILGGGTDIGLWVTKQHRDLPLTVATERVAELRQVTDTDTHVTIGGAVTYADATARLAALHPAIGPLIRRIGSRQIRERGTIGGNLANASPIGDMPPLLLALDAVLILASADGLRRVPVTEFFRSYRTTALGPGEVLAAIEIPRPAAELRLGVYKVSKRFDQDISGVCAAFAVTLAEGRVQSARIAFGGIAATPARAHAAEAALNGAPWSAEGLRAAMDAIDDGFTPISDMRASAGYRKLVARNLLLKFHLENPADLADAIALRLDLAEGMRA